MMAQMINLVGWPKLVTFFFFFKQAADATCSLASVWLALGPSHGQEAAQQLRSVLPTVLGNADTGMTWVIMLS